MTSQAGATTAGADPRAGWRDPPGMGRAIGTGCAIGTALSFVGVTAGMLAVGQVWQSAVGLGLFVSFWGGLGFGSMVGGVVYLTRLEDAATSIEPAAAAEPTNRAAPAAAPTAADAASMVASSQPADAA